MFFKQINLDGTLGKTNYFVTRIEFQVRGRPHIHTFLWIFNAPILSEIIIEPYSEWLDQMISAELPDEDSEPTMFEIYNGILRYASNTGMESADLILVGFLQKELWLQSHCQIV